MTTCPLLAAPFHGETGRGKTASAHGANRSQSFQ